MLIAGEERKSQGPLIVFIDLLFLLVAFFVLLLFFIQARQEISEKSLDRMQQSLARITGEEVNIPEALTRLETVVDRFMAEQKQDLERQRELARRRQRRAERKTQKLEYLLTASGQIEYQGRRYTPAAFLQQVVAPLRKERWVAFRAYADARTPFGKVIESRRLLLRDSNEFDTYWDNVTQNNPAPGSSSR